MKNGNNPAFQSSIGMSTSEIEHLGLTKREYFAGIALQGMLANSKVSFREEDVCRAAIVYVDELLKQLENEPQK